MRSGLRVLVTPRDVGPYQDFLYRDFDSAGVRIRYTGNATPSQTLNVILAPLLLAWWRIGGYRVLHIHWVYHFSLPWARGAKWSRTLMQFWFGTYLRMAKFLGYAIVWTAHNLMPHAQVFLDDEKARDILLSYADMVIALSESTAVELRAMGARKVKVIPIGPYASLYPVVLTKPEARESFGFGDDDVVISLIGRIEPYKGVDLLLQVAAQLPDTSKIKILLAGKCSDATLRSELEHLTLSLRKGTVVVFEWIPNEDLARYMQATDFSAFPFREISNSGSVLLAMSFGLPVLIPKLSSLDDIPDSAVIRFESNSDSLVAALKTAESLSKDEYRDMSIAALAWSTKKDWDNISLETIEAYEIAIRG